MKIEIVGANSEIPVSARVNVVGGVPGRRTVVMTYVYLFPPVIVKYTYTDILIYSFLHLFVMLSILLAFLFSPLLIFCYMSLFP